MKLHSKGLSLAIVVLILMPLLKAVAAEEGAKPSPQDVHHVLIVTGGKCNERGVAHQSAISLLDTGDKPSKETISRLLAMFPNCLSKPAGQDPPIGFKAEYEVFIFVKDDYVRLSIGANGSLWSAGASQFKTKGDFEKFLKELKK
jgi:hypothetical protein